MMGVEPIVFVSSKRRARSPEHPAGVEPAHPAWEAGRLPLHHGCLCHSPGCQRTLPSEPVGQPFQADGVRLESLTYGVIPARPKEKGARRPVTPGPRESLREGSWRHLGKGGAGGTI